MAARKPLTIALADIDVSDRIQPLDEGKAQEIAASIGVHGRVFQSIGIRQTPNGAKKWKLIFGRHRLRALEIQGVAELLDSIHFRVVSADPVQARLIEIEENMARTDVTPFGRAVMLAAYREATGIDGRGAHRRSVDAVGEKRLELLLEGFTAHAMRVFDLGQDDVKRLLRIGTTLAKPEGLSDRLHGSRIARNQSQLLKLSALPEEQLARAAEAFDAAKGDFFVLMSILNRSPESQSQMLGKLQAGASLAEVTSVPLSKPAGFDHWQQAISAYSQLDFKGRVTATVEHWKHDEKAVRAAIKTLGYDLVKLEGGK